MRETELYPPIKIFLEGQDYEVKAEIGAADVVACRGDEPPVVVELKTRFSLSLVHQGVARQSVSDAVYIAVPRRGGKQFQTAVTNMKSLCRRLGLGLITVRMRDDFVEVHCDPAPFQPRKSKIKRDRLLREFARRTGDPNTGGSTRSGLVTAYRQDAVRCAAHLARSGPSRGAEVAKQTGVETATRMLAVNHYGWFCRIDRGIYDLTDAGRLALSVADDTSQLHR
jgi:hypothetical protein